MRRVSVFALPVSGVSLRHLEQTIALGETEAALRLLDWRLGLSWLLLGEGWPGARGRGRAAPRPPCPVLGDTGPVHVLEAKRTAGWPPSLSQLFRGSGFRGIGSDGYRARLTIKKKMIARRPVGSAGPCHARCSRAPRRSPGRGPRLAFRHVRARSTISASRPAVRRVLPSSRLPQRRLLCRLHGAESPPEAGGAARGPFAGPRAQRTAVTGTTVCPGRNTAPSSAPRGSHPRPIKPQGLRVPVRQTRPACPIQHSWPRRSLRPTAPRDPRAP